MKYLLLCLLFVSCSDDKITQQDIELAKCLCETRKGHNLNGISLQGKGDFQITCTATPGAYDVSRSDYYEGCTK